MPGASVQERGDHLSAVRAYRSCAKERARFAAVVDLPPLGCALVTRSDLTGRSRFARSIAVRRPRIDSRKRSIAWADRFLTRIFAGEYASRRRGCASRESYRAPAHQAAGLPPPGSEEKRHIDRVRNDNPDHTQHRGKNQRDCKIQQSIGKHLSVGRQRGCGNLNNGVLKLRFVRLDSVVRLSRSSYNFLSLSASLFIC